MTPTPDARLFALSVLDDLERRDRYADVALDAALRRAPGLGPADRALASHLVYGVLRWKNRLDAHLARASARPLSRTHPKVLQVLRLGAYQILFLDRVPDRAAVHTAVDLTRAAGHAHAAGFVNAVLRRVARDGPQPPPARDRAEELSLLYGCPRWLVERWCDEHGWEGAERLCRAASRVPARWLRVRGPADASAAELRAAGLEAEPGAFAPGAVRVDGRGDPRQWPLLADGRAVVQDQASQLVVHLLDPRPGERVLDACAGPGIKTTQLAEAVGPDGRVTAVDVHPHRVRAVLRLAAETGAANVDAVVSDSRSFAFPAAFDRVLVDAPCSGLGVLARNPDAKWRRGPDSLGRFPVLQAALLHNLAAAVRPGGVLVYATCTTLAAENDRVVDAFLAANPAFSPAPPPDNGVRWDKLVDAGGRLRTFPGAQDGTGPEELDGFFAARLAREEGRG